MASRERRYFYTKAPVRRDSNSSGRGRRTLRATNPRQLRSREARRTYIYDADTPRLLTTPKHFAYVKIAEGCDYTCAFCIIPTLRGSYRSRDDRVDRSRSALDGGARRARAAADLAGHELLRHRSRRARGAGAAAARAEQGRGPATGSGCSTSIPTTITDDVLEAMAECEKVCRYVDLPLQHASAAMLKRMRRPGNRATYDKLLARIRDARSRRHTPYDLHRGLPRRDRCGFRRARVVRAGHRLRSRRRLHLLARGRHARLRAGRRRAGRG